MTLLPEERALLGARAAPRRVLEFTLGRGCAHAALAALAAQHQRDASLAARLAATPILREDARRPRWPAGYVGAITHHRGHAAAAVARAADYLGLGVDLEALRPPSPALVRRILRPEERAAWEALPAAERTRGFALAFSAKESLFKALYPHTGVYLGFQEATVALTPQDPAAAAQALPRWAVRWVLHKGCGEDFPVGAAGVGAALAQEGYVLSGVWVPRADAMQGATATAR